MAMAIVTVVIPIRVLEQRAGVVIQGTVTVEETNIGRTDLPTGLFLA
jgi:hypothetical protein